MGASPSPSATVTDDLIHAAERAAEDAFLLRERAARAEPVDGVAERLLRGTRREAELGARLGGVEVPELPAHGERGREVARPRRLLVEERLERGDGLRREVL